MTPAEKIQAAIDKLEALKAESIGGDWRVLRKYAYEPEVRVQAYFQNELNGNTRVADVREYRRTPELIVTLHRTIDAQLGILRVGIEFSGITPNRYTDTAVALADAILGEDS